MQGGTLGPDVGRIPQLAPSKDTIPWAPPGQTTASNLERAPQMPRRGPCQPGSREADVCVHSTREAYNRT
ncbi:hypothetical protein nbrc107696_44050 [Gordonia spumicola]|uniref:Uncharacterized protein n=1 Tax=Gordonia spumicola TaxID=589161 RepID=A0A7I9VF06_9ACTN|nr:hypothetical protein nbrc107696_44050 [Gordonia spumicola]